MSLFGKESKDEKNAKKEQEELQKFIEKYNLTKISQEDLVILRRISNELIGTTYIKEIMALKSTKVEEQVKIVYLSTLVEQNWMMIKLLSEISSKLDEAEK